MRNIFTLTLAASFVAGSLLATAPQAFAKQRHHDHADLCANKAPIGELAVVGLVLGAVTGGVGSAVVYGGAYALGGAAIGGGGGLLLGAVHEGRHCRT